MGKVEEKKIITDIDVKRKASKLVVSYMRKKVEGGEFEAMQSLDDWLNEMDQLLKKEEFVLKEYHDMRRILNDIIERTTDDEIRFKLRRSWYSLGKALDKKVKK